MLLVETARAPCRSKEGGEAWQYCWTSTRVCPPHSPPLRRHVCACVWVWAGRRRTKCVAARASSRWRLLATQREPLMLSFRRCACILLSLPLPLALSPSTRCSPSSKGPYEAPLRRPLLLPRCGAGLPPTPRSHHTTHTHKRRTLLVTHASIVLPFPVPRATRGAPTLPPTDTHAANLACCSSAVFGDQRAAVRLPTPLPRLHSLTPPLPHASSPLGHR